ncbi:hypothetical protein FSARC_1108 [Fusarium sarcochroum]|uniref:Uncharacterized protein n=1 Tax=Fusarium sarcochroum TaxID=1208366 RepID=A0A8H4XEL4_9HYPO|nr:hypothetical protein FSARC_1108 [Fusarium sarcochroum]
MFSSTIAQALLFNHPEARRAENTRAQHKDADSSTLAPSFTSPGFMREEVPPRQTTPSVLSSDRTSQAYGNASGAPDYYTIGDSDDGRSDDSDPDYSLTYIDDFGEAVAITLPPSQDSSPRLQPHKTVLEPGDIPTSNQPQPASFRDIWPNIPLQHFEPGSESDTGAASEDPESASRLGSSHRNNNEEADNNIEGLKHSHQGYNEDPGPDHEDQESFTSAARLLQLADGDNNPTGLEELEDFQARGGTLFDLHNYGHPYVRGTDSLKSVPASPIKDFTDPSPAPEYPETANTVQIPLGPDNVKEDGEVLFANVLDPYTYQLWEHGPPENDAVPEIPSVPTSEHFIFNALARCCKTAVNDFKPGNNAKNKKRLNSLNTRLSLTVDYTSREVNFIPVGYSPIHQEGYCGIREYKLG